MRPTAGQDPTQASPGAPTTPMLLDTLRHDPDTARFRQRYPAGTTIFLEGDEGQDLYILEHGRLEVLKGRRVLAAIEAEGAFVGEMAFLLGEKRTATVRAAEESVLLRIPASEVASLTERIPSFCLELARHLAERLRSTTSMAHGFKEFCDQLPDAVMVTTDRDLRITAWNAAAERLYGRTAEEMQHLRLADLYDDPAAYETVQESIAQRRSGECATGRIRLPDGSERYIAASVTPLFDGHYNVQGVLLLARDVTRLQEAEQRYRRLRNWILPGALAILLLAGGLVWSWPQISRGTQVLDYQKENFRQHVAQAVADLGRLLAAAPQQPPSPASGPGTVIGTYLEQHDLDRYGITDILLIGPDLKVKATGRQQSAALVGSSYAAFHLTPERPVRLLRLFRPTPNHPTGKETYELLFTLPGNTGWLALQLDTGELARAFGLTPAILERMPFSP